MSTEDEDNQSFLPLRVLGRAVDTDIVPGKSSQLGLDEPVQGVGHVRRELGVVR